MRVKSGFTLIELLVVIAIIALLMGILTPVLSKARDQARTVSCRSNLHQYGLAIRMYLDDSGQYFPDAGRWLKSAGHSYVRKGEQPDGVFWPYVKALDVHLCAKFSAVAKGTNWENTAVSYVLNSYLGRGGSIWSDWLGDGVAGVTKETEVYSPSMVVLFTEENPWKIEDYSKYPFNDTHFTVGNSDTQIDNYATFHNAPGDINRGGANIVCVDGHVEFLPRVEDPDTGFRLAWPKKEVPYAVTP